MKRLLVVLMAIALCACLFVGCSDAISKDRWANTGFTWIETKGGMEYIYHNDTKVIYVFKTVGNSAGMTVLLNPDGTPVIWEGE
jgi:hypothetical protein